MNCLGKRIESFPVFACELPKNVLLEGLLGMDFLKICNAVIDVNQAEITVVV
jgi:aspartyl protease family protein